MVDIAVIGHGKSPEGKGWGSRIDACDYVIRMWNWKPWQGEADYGTKYDYGVLEDLAGILRKFETYHQGEPTCGYVVSKLTGACGPLPRGSILVDQKPWNEIGMGLGGMGATGRLQFSRGTVAACWAITSAAEHDRVILVGFDNVHAGTALPIKTGFATAWQTDPTNYWAGYKTGRRYGNHDFFCEGPTMQVLAAKHGVLVQFAQDLWM